MPLRTATEKEAEEADEVEEAEERTKLWRTARLVFSPLPHLPPPL